MKQTRKILALLLAVVMIVALISVVPSGVNAEELSGQVVIIHTNDIHSRIDENMGYARVATLVKQYEAKGATVLVIDAGDALHGFPVANITNGNNIVDIMNAVGYDYFVPGNHDFNYGIQRLLAIAGKTSTVTDAHKLDAKVLAANVTKDGTSVFDSNNIIELNGKKFGIFGLATPETLTKSHPDNTKGYTFADPSTVAQAQVDDLKAKGAEYIICVGHLGVDAESEPYRSSDVITKVNGINLFIDGHSHTTFDKGELVGSTLVVSTGDYLKNVGVVTINGDSTTATLVSDKSVAEDETVKNLITSMRAETDKLMDVVIGKTTVLLDGNRAPGNRTQETNLGDLAADAMRYTGNADIAMTNGGGIRASIKVGDITKNDLFTVFPFGNYLVTKQVTVETVKQILEHGIQSAPNASGGFPQVSGMNFSYNPNNEVGDKIVTLSINGVIVYQNGSFLVDKATTYVMATNNFTAAGGDGYTMIGASKEVGQFGALEEVMINYINYVNGSSVISMDDYATTTGRIIATEVETAQVAGFKIVDGNLVVTYNDGVSSNLGRVVGENGKDGVNGANGAKGEAGVNGKDAPTTLVVALSIIAIVASAAAVIIVLTKKK